MVPAMLVDCGDQDLVERLEGSLTMQRFRKILVPVGDHAGPHPLLPRAARLARQNGAALKLVAVVEDLPWYSRLVLPNVADLQAAFVRERAQALDEPAAELRREGLAVTTEVLRGRRHVALVQEVLRNGHDLLIKEAEPNASVLFGSTDMHLLRSCPCPVWLFKAGQAGRAFARILAAVDPALPPDEMDLLHLKTGLAPKDPSLDARVLALAGSLAESEGAELHIVHAWDAPGEGLLLGDSMLEMVSQAQVDRYVEDARAEARKALDRLLAAAPAGPAERRYVHLIRGNPADVIADLVQSCPVDLIVMGTVARTGVPGLLIGNTAETILQRVDCSVLAVKPAAFVASAAPDTPAAPSKTPE